MSNPATCSKCYEGYVVYGKLSESFFCNACLRKVDIPEVDA